MRLTELEPRWVAVGHPGFVVSENKWAANLPIRRGVTFKCPHCGTQRLGVMFDPPINPSGFIIKDEPEYKGQLTWMRESGETFETLTLSPSLDVGFAGHWHGHIKNGEVT